MELETFPIDFRNFGVSYREEAFINSIDAFFLAQSKIQKIGFFQSSYMKFTFLTLKLLNILYTPVSFNCLLSGNLPDL